MVQRGGGEGAASGHHRGGLAVPFAISSREKKGYKLWRRDCLGESITGFTGRAEAWVKGAGRSPYQSQLMEQADLRLSRRHCSREKESTVSLHTVTPAVLFLHLWLLWVWGHGQARWAFGRTLRTALQWHWEGYFRAANIYRCNNPVAVMPSPRNSKLRPVLAGTGTEG